MNQIPLVFGIGQCSLDYIGLIPAYPPPDVKCEFTHLVVQGGGPVATALVALQRWGANCHMAGVAGHVIACFDDTGLDAARCLTDRPVIGIGGIATIDDVLEFMVAGASAVQIGTANYYDPTVTMKLLDALPAALAEAGVGSVAELVGSLQVPAAAKPNAGSASSANI